MKNANKTKKGRPAGGDASTAPTPAERYEYANTPEENGTAGRSMGFSNKKAKANMSMYRNPLS